MKNIGAPFSMLTFIFGLLMIFTSPLPAQQIEPFTLKTLSGEYFSFCENSEVKVTVLTFFTTWCTPCSQEHPHLERLYKKYHSRGLNIVAISSDVPGNKSKVRLWVHRYRLTFPVLLDDQSEITRRYNPDLNFPLTMLLDADNNVCKIYQSYHPGDEKQLEEDLLNLLEQLR